MGGIILVQQEGAQAVTVVPVGRVVDLHPSLVGEEGHRAAADAAVVPALAVLGQAAEVLLLAPVDQVGGFGQPHFRAADGAGHRTVEGHVHAADLLGEDGHVFIFRRKDYAVAGELLKVPGTDQRGGGAVGGHRGVVDVVHIADLGDAGVLHAPGFLLGAGQDGGLLGNFEVHAVGAAGHPQVRQRSQVHDLAAGRAGTVNLAGVREVQLGMLALHKGNHVDLVGAVVVYDYGHADLVLAGAHGGLGHPAQQDHLVIVACNAAVEHALHFKVRTAGLYVGRTDQRVFFTTFDVHTRIPLSVVTSA